MAEEMWGVVAYGRCGQVELEIIESVDEPKRFVMEICLPAVEVNVVVTDPGVAAALSQFLREHGNRKTCAKMQLGTIGDVPAWIIKDNEFADRFWIRAGADWMIDVPIVDPLAGDFARAAEDLAGDIG